MRVTDELVEELAGRLDEAAAAHATIAAVTKEADLDLAGAYRVQTALVRRRLDRGERLVGGKLGLTSRAKQLAMGVDSPLYGFVTGEMAHADGAVLDLSEFIHPRVEPEIAFVLGAPLAGPDVTVADVLAATRYVCPALDVIDSRYEGFSFTHLDAVADNASSAAFALGSELSRPDRDLALAGCVLEVNGQVVDSAAGAAVMGHPAAAVAFMANQLVALGRHLEAGWVVLSGGLTVPVPLAPGRLVTATVNGLGSVTLGAR